MTLYEFKMHLKRFGFVKSLLRNKRSKEENTKRDALKDDGRALIIDIENALKEMNIIFFADYGTLLGIIRDHKFISWDNDLDYGLLIDDSFDWKYFEQELSKSGFRKVREFEFKGHVKEQTYSKGILTVDFFGHQNLQDKSMGLGFFRKENYIYQSRNEFHVRKVEYVKIVDTKTVEFLGTTVHVPQNAEEYLESMYTKSWKIPDPKWSDDNNPNRNIEVLQELGRGTFYD